MPRLIDVLNDEERAIKHRIIDYEEKFNRDLIYYEKKLDKLRKEILFLDARRGTLERQIRELANREGIKSFEYEKRRKLIKNPYELENLLKPKKERKGGAGSLRNPYR